MVKVFIRDYVDNKKIKINVKDYIYDPSKIRKFIDEIKYIAKTSNSIQIYDITKGYCHGKIIDVKRFKLNLKDSIDQILSKTYKLQLNQFKYVIRSLKKSNTIQKLINNSKKEKWSKKLYTQSMLENLYNINRQMEKKNFELELYLRATITKNFKPYYKVGEKLFYIS